MARGAFTFGCAGPMLGALVIAGVYLVTILGCTMWGAIRLAPAVMTYLLSVEIFAGVLAIAGTVLLLFALSEATKALLYVAGVSVEVAIWLGPLLLGLVVGLSRGR